MDPAGLAQDRRRANRRGVLKRAELVAGNAVFDCIVLDSSESGARVRIEAAMPLPEHVQLRLAGGVSVPAVSRWGVGTELGLEFGHQEPQLNRAAAERAWTAYEAVRAGRLDAALRLLRTDKFFDDEALRRAAEEADAARARLEQLLRERAQSVGEA
jgi:hypothetical protein